MRKIVAGFAASLDGYIEGPNGEYDWILIDKEIDFSEHMKRFDAYFFGRITYQKVATRSSKPIPGITNYVFSRTLKTVNKNYTLIKDDIKERVEAIKQGEGKDIAVFGGANLLASLLDLELVDELSVAIIPVLLGKGKPMVDLLKNNVWLSLMGSKTYSNGTVQVSYQVNKNGG